MGQQEVEVKREEYPKGRTELLERIEISWQELNHVLNTLSQDEILKPGPSGWSVKDHLAHLAAWELGIVALLLHKDRWQAMGVPEAADGSLNNDEINERIQRLHTELTADQALEALRSAHQQMVEVLTGMGNEQLYKPYYQYLPDGAEEPTDQVVYSIGGNTFEHFDEHREYIKQLVGR
jgi:hypothetical protein